MKPLNPSTIRSGSIALGALLFTSVQLMGCGNPSSFSIAKSKTEFQQAKEQTNNKLDILWVVDNSGSMDPFQKNLAENFSSFMNTFINQGFDYRLAVTTTDAYLANSAFRNDPSLAAFSDGNPSLRTGVPIVTPLTLNPLDTFVANALVGSKGAGDERAFQSFLESLENPVNKGFFREGSFLAVVILSDEDDFSDPTRPERTSSNSSVVKDHDYSSPGLLSVQDVVKRLDAYTGSLKNDRRYNVSAITIKDEDCEEQHKKATSAAIQGRRYVELAKQTDGIVGNICDASFAQSLEFIQRKIVELVTQFRLDRGIANPNTIRVYVNDELVPRDKENGWTYERETNSIQFHGSAVPDPGAKIFVDYDPATLD